MREEVREQIRTAEIAIRQAEATYEQASKEYQQGREQRLQNIAEAQADLRDAMAKLHEWENAQLLRLADRDLLFIEKMARNDPAEFERMIHMVRTIIDEKEVSPERPIVIEGPPDEETSATDARIHKPGKPQLTLSAEFGTG